MLSALLASIPSPSFNSIGPFTMYGLSIGVGVAAAVVLSQRRWSAMGGGDDDMATIAMWGIPAGVVGARLYHVITDFQRFSDGPWYKPFLITEGGLGVPGGMLLGLAVGAWAARRNGVDLPGGFDAVAPALPLAQAVGRLGNYFNQELYGRPTDLPWALEIDGNHRSSVPEEFRDVDAFPTFHPTFLYEMLWNLALVFVILRIDRRKVLSRGRLMSVYMIGYGIGRLWLETVKIDTVNTILGLRINIWMSLLLILGGVALLNWPSSGNDHGSTKERAPKTDEDRGDKKDSLRAEAKES